MQSDTKGNIRDEASLNELLVLANLESYNAILIGQGKKQSERMMFLRELAISQLRTLDGMSSNNLSELSK